MCPARLPGPTCASAPSRWGVAVSRATGEIGIDNRLLGQDLMDASLTTVLPYLRWSPAAGADLWAMGGYGWGEAGLRDAAPGGSDLGMRMAALGGRTELARLGAVSLGLRADAFAASLGTEAMAELGEVTAGVTQSRLALTLGTGFGSAVRFEPQLDIGARMDGGDAETGAGMEVGGSIGLLGANGSVRLDGSGRWLVAHQVEGFEDWGASVSLAIGSPQGGSEGFGLTLEPEWGGQRMHDPLASRDGVGLGNVGGRGRAFAVPGAGADGHRRHVAARPDAPQPRLRALTGGRGWFDGTVRGRPGRRRRPRDARGGQGPRRRCGRA